MDLAKRFFLQEEEGTSEEKAVSETYYEKYFGDGELLEQMMTAPNSRLFKGTLRTNQRLR